MNVYTQDSPGDWQDWVKMPRNKNMPILEAKQKFLNEQLLHENQYQSFVQQQVAIQTQKAQTGGTKLNGVKDVNFDALPAFQTITANVQTIMATFALPITVVSGTPQIVVTNDQAGNGSNATFPYTYTAGSGTKSLTFSHTHPLATNNQSGFSGNVLGPTGTQIIAGGGTLVQPTSANSGSYSFTTEFSSSISGSGASLVVVVNADTDQIDTIAVNNIGINYIPGEIITFNNNAFGSGSTGGSIEILANSMVADTVSFAAGSSIILNGAVLQTGDGSFNTQYNDVNRRQSTPALNFASTSTKTGVIS